jgi:hypothetical protein
MDKKTLQLLFILSFLLHIFNFFYTYSISESQIEHIVNEKIITKITEIPFDTINKAYDGKILHFIKIDYQNTTPTTYKYKFSFKSKDNKIFSCITNDYSNPFFVGMNASIVINRNNNCSLIGIDTKSKT